MLETKAFELRDEGTFIPIIATRMVAQPFYYSVSGGTIAGLTDRITPRERWLLRRAGYSFDPPLMVLLCRMDANGGARQATYDPYDWGGRTFPVAHKYITEHWDELVSGQLIDARYILGESPQPCTSEYE